MKTQVNLKIDASVKRDAQKRASELGLSLSSLVNVTLKQFARTGGIELSVAPKMTAYLEDIVRESRTEFESGKAKGPFLTAEAMMKSLDS
ncbi:MAG: type II toxin-antitoxin system RelB/DinJ family antitoxin [Candidatus Parcubacteria bacterium]|nr:type II toxin-antitoxin system RelB/DinJ family antitoxin [Candidatus Parcubacteria bacterium]